jgi:hypothetical protein
MGGRHGGWNEKWRIKYSKYYGSKKKNQRGFSLLVLKLIRQVGDRQRERDTERERGINR